jgi:hypothetical protein
MHITMRVMVMVKATPEFEAGAIPDGKMMSKMATFNAELVKAGVMLAGEGLRNSSKGTRVHFAAGKQTVVDGPFAEAKELIGGYWIWNVASRAEAIEWAKKIPFDDGDVEIREIAEPDDYAANDPNGKIRAREAALREKLPG